MPQERKAFHDENVPGNRTTLLLLRIGKKFVTTNRNDSFVCPGLNMPIHKFN